MAEDKPGVQNKGLLIAAVVVGLLVVVAYNYQITQVRKAGRSGSVEVLTFAQSRDAGEEIKENFFKRIHVDRSLVKSLDNVVNLEDYSMTDIIGHNLRVPVQSGMVLRWRHFRGDSGERPSSAIRKGMESFTVDIEPRRSPGTMLHIGDHVALMGIFTIKGKTRTYRIMEHVRVLSVGGITAGSLAARTRSNRTSGMSQRTFRSLGIELTSDASKRLNNVLTHLEGPLRVVVMSQGSDSDGSGKPRIHPDLRDLPALGEGIR